MTDKEIREEIERLEELKAQRARRRKGDMHTVASAVGEHLALGMEKLNKAGIPMDYSEEFLSSRVYDGMRAIMDRMGVELRVKEV